MTALAPSVASQVLNALLLACSGHSGERALEAMQLLLAKGAVCDTWAPNGSSVSAGGRVIMAAARAMPAPGEAALVVRRECPLLPLFSATKLCSAKLCPRLPVVACLCALLPCRPQALMLSAAIDSTRGVELLLAHGATLELQDALGRTALMFAAGNDATAALGALLAAGASVSIRDRRGRNVLDYAVAGSAARAALEAHLAALESKASELQVRAVQLAGRGSQAGEAGKRAGGGENGGCQATLRTAGLEEGAGSLSLGSI